MKITREQFAQLRSICKKFNVSPESVNLKKLFTVDPRLLRRRVALTYRLKWNVKRQSLTVSPQCARRVDIIFKYLEKRAKKTKQPRWKNILRKLHRRQQKEILMADDEEADDAEASAMEQEMIEEETQKVRDQIKTQLQLLQTRKQMSFCHDETSNDIVMKGKSRAQ